MSLAAVIKEFRSPLRCVPSRFSHYVGGQLLGRASIDSIAKTTRSNPPAPVSKLNRSAGGGGLG